MNEKEMTCTKCRVKITDNILHMFNSSKDKWEFYCRNCFKIGVPLDDNKKVAEDQIKLEFKYGIH